MARSFRSVIKAFFQTGDVPTETQFGDSFDSQVFWNDDVVTDLTTNDDDHVPTVKAVVDAIAAVSVQDLQSVTDIGNITTNSIEVNGLVDTAGINTAGINSNGGITSQSGGIVAIGGNIDAQGGFLVTSENGVGASGIIRTSNLSTIEQYQLPDKSGAGGTFAMLSDIPSGGGDVVGPASSIDSNVAFFDGTTGKLIKDSGLTLSGTNTGDQDLSGLMVKANNLSDLASATTALTNLGMDIHLPVVNNGTDGTTVTGTTAITPTYAELIDPKYITDNMMRNIVFGYRKTGTAGNTILYLYLNTTPNLSGSPILIGNTGALTATTGGSSGVLQRNIAIKVKNGSGAGSYILSTASTSMFDVGFASTGARASIAPDFTGTIYLVAALKLSNGVDSAVGDYLKMI